MTISSKPVTRFAPAPTGFLHLGHVVNALYVWGVARAGGGRVLLRIEDHDRQRSRKEYEASILEDLEWLGLTPDETMVRQSERFALYQDMLARLRARYRVYACECSRRDLAQSGEDVPGLETRYPGICRGKQLEWRPGLALRIELEEVKVEFIDLLMGRQVQEPSLQCGDLLVMDRLGNWTYQFAVAVDDLLQGVNLVIRGEDLLTSTGRQILLGRMLGRTEPAAFLHHALVRKPGGDKLSKAQGDTGIRELRQRGESPALVLGRAAHAVGLIDSVREAELGEISGIFKRHPQITQITPIRFLDP